MNAPQFDVVTLIESRALSLHTRLVGAFLLARAKRAPGRTADGFPYSAGEVWWSNEGLSERLGISLTDVKAAVKWLAAHGLLVDTGRKRNRAIVRRMRAPAAPLDGTTPAHRTGKPRRVGDGDRGPNSDHDLGPNSDHDLGSNSDHNCRSNWDHDHGPNSDHKLEEVNPTIEITPSSPPQADDEAEQEEGGDCHSAEGDTGPHASPAPAGAAIGESSKAEGEELPTLVWEGPRAWHMLLADEIADAWPEGSRHQRAGELWKMGIAPRTFDQVLHAEHEYRQGGWERLRRWGRERLNHRAKFGGGLVKRSSAAPRAIYEGSQSSSTPPRPPPAPASKDYDQELPPESAAFFGLSTRGAA